MTLRLVNQFDLAKFYRGASMGDLKAPAMTKLLIQC